MDQIAPDEGGNADDGMDQSGVEPKRTTRPRPPAMVSYARVDRPLVSSGIFRMWPPNVRGDEQAALEAVLLNRIPSRTRRNGGGLLGDAEDLSSFQIETIGYASRIEYQHRLLLLSSAYTLGSEEILVLVATCGLAGMLHHNGARYEEQRRRSPKRLAQRQVHVSLATLPDGEQVFRVEGSLRALVAECGLANTGPCRNRVLVSLLRLSGVTCVDLGPAVTGASSGRTRAPAFQTGPRLLTVRVGHPPEHMVQLELNVRLTNAALQRTARDGDSVHVDLWEARAVSDGARILLVRLSERVRLGSAGTPVRIDEMVEWIYGPQVPEQERSKSESAAVSMRRTRARMAAARIAQLPGWTAEQPRALPSATNSGPRASETIVFRRLGEDEAETRRKALVDGRPPAVPPALRMKTRRPPRRSGKSGAELW